MKKEAYERANVLTNTIANLEHHIVELGKTKKALGDIQEIRLTSPNTCAYITITEFVDPAFVEDKIDKEINRLKSEIKKAQREFSKL